MRGAHAAHDGMLVLNPLHFSFTIAGACCCSYKAHLLPRQVPMASSEDDSSGHSVFDAMPARRRRSTSPGLLPVPQKKARHQQGLRCAIYDHVKKTAKQNTSSPSSIRPAADEQQAELKTQRAAGSEHSTDVLAISERVHHLSVSV